MENNAAYNEGAMTEAIERQTAKMPSDLFLFAGLASMGLALTLKCFGKKHTALLIGQWAAPILIMGLYDKVVKLEGHDRNDKTRQTSL